MIWPIKASAKSSFERSLFTLRHSAPLRCTALSKFMQGGRVILASSILEAHGLHEMQLNLKYELQTTSAKRNVDTNDDLKNGSFCER